MKKWYGNYSNFILEMLETDSKMGLSEEVIKDRKEKYGKNIVNISYKRNNLKQNVGGIIKPITILQIILAIFFVYDSKLVQGILMFLMVLGLSVVDFKFNSRNDEKIKQIEKINNGRAKCIRDGMIKMIDAQDIVVGDIIFLDEGDVIHADMRLIDSANLQVKETSITGINDVVEKYETKIEERIENITELTNILFKSSLVVKGQATAVVIAVGMNTQIGGIIRDINIDDSDDKIFEEIKGAIYGFKYKMVGCTALFLTVILIRVKEAVILYDYIELSLYATNLVVVIIPIILFSIYIKKYLHKKGIDIQNVYILNKLAAISMIILNNREFMCEKETLVVELFTDGESFKSSDEDRLKEYNSQRLMQIAILCNDFNLRGTEGKKRNPDYVEDTTDLSLINFSREMLLDKTQQVKYSRIFEIPNDTDRKMMTTVNSIDDNYRANVKGDPDEILKRCTHIMKNGVEVEIQQSDINAVKKSMVEMSNNTLRVIAFAYRNFGYEPSEFENIESHLVFVGIIGVTNPIKEEFKEDLGQCDELNVQNKVILEDNKLFAFSLGKKLNILRGVDQVLSGVELKHMDNEEKLKIIDRIKLFCNIPSEYKSDIVKRCKEQNQVTAFTTHSFKDLPAFSVASVSIATGENCSNTIKKISDVFIEKHSLTDLIELIKSARIAIINLNMALVYFATIVLSELLLLVVQFAIFPELKMGYAVISAINLICIPINMIYLMFKINYKDRELIIHSQSQFGVRIGLSLSLKNAIKIVFLISAMAFGLNFFGILNSYAAITVGILSAQYIVKRSFVKNEIYG